MDRLRTFIGLIRIHLGVENKGLFRQAYEIVLLHLSGKLSPFQYYDYQLCRRGASIEGLNYLGRQTYWKMQHKLNNPTWFGVTENKWLFYTHMLSFGLPIPRSLGYFDTINGRTAEGKRLRCSSDLKEMIEALGDTEFVIKPILGGKGNDVLVLKPHQDMHHYESLDGHTFSLEDLVSFMSTKPFLIQEKVKQHPFLEGLNPYTLNTFRIVTFIDIFGEPQVHWTGIRMGRKGSNTDNYHGGGIYANIDHATGEINAGYTGSGCKGITSHPDTGMLMSIEK